MGFKNFNSQNYKDREWYAEGIHMGSLSKKSRPRD